MTSDRDAHNLFNRQWDVPWHAHLVPLGLAALMSVFWLTFSSAGQMTSWALSWPALQQGRISLLAAHMFAHGGLLHLSMNLAALMLFSGPLISRLGPPPISWVRYLYLFFGSGLCGAALFLAASYGNRTSILGASGAIFGIVGALARVHPATGEVVPIRSVRTWLLAKFFVQNHILLIALLAIMGFFAWGSAAVAWEAHLGGLLFGFFATPLYLAGSRFAADV